MVLHFHSSSQIAWLSQRPSLHRANCLLLWTSRCISPSFWILCDRQSTTVPVPYKFSEDVICTKLIVYVSSIITSVRILMRIVFVLVVLCIGDTTFLHFLIPIMKMHANVCIFNYYGLPALPTPPKKSWQMPWNLRVFYDSRLPTLTTPPKKSW